MDSNEEYKTFPMYLRAGRASMLIPSQMSEDDYELLRAQIETSMSVIKVTSIVKKQDAQPEPGEWSEDTVPGEVSEQ